jgi:hypothetical protein
MSKPTIGMLVGLFVSMSMLAFAPALAGPHTDAMAECLVRSTSDSDRTSLVKWIFTTLSLHPAVKSLSTITDVLRDEMNKTVARLIETLLTESCRSEAQGAIKHEGPTRCGRVSRSSGRSRQRQCFPIRTLATALVRSGGTCTPAGSIGFWGCRKELESLTLVSARCCRLVLRIGR